MMKKRKINDKSSFRDPDGFVFYDRGILYRQVNQSYREDFELLINSGLYKSLVNKGFLVAHKTTPLKHAVNEKAYKVIKPELIPFISYPYSWSFSQLKDAALLTLQIQKEAIKHGMVLKDASSYNIQFIGVKPVLIDTLSFKKYKEGEPWVAYRQFCQHFLAPLSLMAYTDPRLNIMLRDYIDGIPVDLASKLLPFKTSFRFGLLTHIHLHASLQKRYSEKAVDKAKFKMDKKGLIALTASLEKTILRLRLPKINTEWSNYQDKMNYTRASYKHKESIVIKYIKKIKVKTVWDLGANKGDFTRLALKSASYAISADIDPVAVEKNYLLAKKEGDRNILPLVWDLTNPPPSIGWANSERRSFTDRGNPRPCYGFGSYYTTFA
jgi:hypothetical protein